MRTCYNVFMPTLSPSLQSMLDNRLRYLPEITGRAIASIDWSSKLITIGKKYGLHIDDMEDFQTVVLKSMIGLVPPEQFETEIISAVALSPVDTEKIIHEINDQVFEPIHDFVVSGGKTDVLKTTGLEITPAAPEIIQPVVSHREIEPASAESSFEIPASPESFPTKPIVSGDFSAFFNSQK